MDKLREFQYTELVLVGSWTVHVLIMHNDNSCLKKPHSTTDVNAG